MTQKTMPSESNSLKTKTIFGRPSQLMKKGAFFKNYSLFPILFITAFGTFAGLFSAIRCLLRSPDVSLTRSNPEPWQAYENKQYKLYSNIDHENYKHPRPKF
ncbi:cytochrome c oxidase subunit NDUFA4-like protein [Dinothrombium tinctorium]|uniref:Cytochrome c oxidase subunit NDUFA4-like protein n=1 Tax=Dinothrombium tinctorium TaxID=1965070 RepID=A0A443RAI2_9ACAR|nr:cytochrome c oxidase subunit NDUFA4-like protein [Dinothrombium tinctorium]